MSKIDVLRAYSVSSEMWHRLQELGVRACEADFKEGYDPEAYMGWDEQKRFTESHRNPNTEVGRRYNSNQVYFGARVAVATEAGKPVGWLYLAAHNVSYGNPNGSQDNSLKAQATKAYKIAVGSHDYVWWRETYTDPGYSRSVRMGMETDMLRSALGYVKRDRPVATYPEKDLLEDETTDIQTYPWLSAAGFKITQEYTKEIAGIEIPALRMQHDSSRQLRESL